MVGGMAVIVGAVCAPLGGVGKLPLPSAARSNVPLVAALKLSGDRSQIFHWLFQRPRATLFFQPHLPAFSSKQSHSALWMVLLM